MRIFLQTDTSGFSVVSSSQHQSVLLTSPSSVSKSRKRSFLANAMHAKLQQLANDITDTAGNATSSASSEISKFGSSLGYENHFNQNKLELDSSLDEILQPKRSLFIPRY